MFLPALVKICKNSFVAVGFSQLRGIPCYVAVYMCNFILQLPGLPKLINKLVSNLDSCCGSELHLNFLVAVKECSKRSKSRIKAFHNYSLYTQNRHRPLLAARSRPSSICPDILLCLEK